MKILQYRILLPVLLLIMVSLLAGGCMSTAPTMMIKPEPAKSVDARLVNANMDLGFNIFSKLSKNDPGQNIFISPASIAMALAMTYNGAGGETKEAMAKTLGLQEMNIEEVNSANADLKTILENPDPEVKISIANSLWARKGINFKPDFIERNKNYYAAELETLDFLDPSAADTINKWVNDNTGGKIDKIIESINQDSIMFLINAIYFKGNWADKFDRSQTKESLFYLPDGTQKKHPMMSRTGQYGYLLGSSFQAVRIPYGSERVSMYVFLPAQDSNLDKFYRLLNTNNWEKWMLMFTETELHLVLPKFTFEYEISLKETLKTLGMEIAFDGGKANFGNMCPVSPAQNVYIGDVKHKTFIDVNEEGTEAAAATSVEMRCTALPQIIDMVVNRPFFFAIRDDQTGTILFMGSVSDPLSS